MENLIAQLEGESSEDLLIRELLGLDKQLRSIRGSLRVEVAEKVQLEERILASLLRRLCVKAAEALPVIIGAILSWILNRATDVVCWVSQNQWTLVVGIGGLL